MMTSMAAPDRPASRTARAIARDQLTAMILAAARSQLAVDGPAALSVRAVAREVGMVSSAVYRYFPSRDALLTELLVSCYDELGTVVETAEASVTDRSDYVGRWLGIASAFRTWAVDHPHDYALVYGSPVPGYVAPRRTVGPATRVSTLIVDLVRQQHEEGRSLPVTEASAELHASLAGVREFAGVDLPDDAVLLGLHAWSGLIGEVTLELFGHLVGAVTDHDVYFAGAARRLAPVIPPGSP